MSTKIPLAVKSAYMVSWQKSGNYKTYLLLHCVCGFRFFFFFWLELLWQADFASRCGFTGNQSCPLCVLVLRTGAGRGTYIGLIFVPFCQGGGLALAALVARVQILHELLHKRLFSLHSGNCVGIIHVEADDFDYVTFRFLMRHLKLFTLITVLYNVPVVGRVFWGGFDSMLALILFLA